MALLILWYLEFSDIGQLRAPKSLSKFRAIENALKHLTLHISLLHPAQTVRSH